MHITFLNKKIQFLCKITHRFLNTSSNAYGFGWFWILFQANIEHQYSCKLLLDSLFWAGSDFLRIGDSNLTCHDDPKSSIEWRSFKYAFGHRTLSAPSTGTEHIRLVRLPPGNTFRLNSFHSTIVL